MESTREVIDLCDTDSDQEIADAPSRINPARPSNPSLIGERNLDPAPWVCLGTIKSVIDVPYERLSTLPETLIVKQDELSNEFQLAVYENVGSIPIAHIPKQLSTALERVVAAKFACLSAIISVNGLKRARRDTGDSEIRSVGISIIVKTRPSFLSGVFQTLQQCAVPLMCDPDAFAVIKAHFEQSNRKASEESRFAPVSHSTSAVNAEQPLIWKLFDSALNLLDSAADTMEPSAFVTTNLYAYQKAGLHWMVKKEREANNEFQNVFWRKFKKSDGSSVYHNLFSQETRHILPTSFKGGILADEMGLGKSLQIIALVMANCKPNNESKFCSLGPTLIVCPLSVVGNWVSQFKVHVSESAELSVSVYHGSNRSSRDLDADVVITTYATLATEFRGFDENKSELCHPFSVNWLRIVLDEGHIIRSQRSQQHAAIIALKGECRWCLSGTPIQNHLDDLFAILKFLRAEPLDDSRIWAKLIAHPFKTGRPEATERVQAIIRAVCLRRTKASEARTVNLPEKRVFLVKVELSSRERELYNILSEAGKLRLSEMAASENRFAGYAGVLELLLRMRMCCDHPSLVPSYLFDSSVKSVAERSPVQVLLDVLKESQDEECLTCLAVVKNPCVTPCAHLFCLDCIKPYVSICKHCPVCDNNVDVDSLICSSSGFSEHSDLAELSGSSSNSCLDASFISSKIQAVLDILRGLEIAFRKFFLTNVFISFRRDDPTIKSVIFSQWVSMLSIVQNILSSEGFGIKRLDGSMSRSQRENAMKSFQDDPGISIFIISLQAGNLGVTLNAACRVFLLDLWFNPGVEEQAIDRVHRVGQKRPVDVYRLIAVETVEEKILALQDRKKEIMRKAVTSRKQDKPVKNVFEEINYLIN